MSRIFNTCGLWAVTAFQGPFGVTIDAGADARRRMLSQRSVYFTTAVKCFGG